jgi:hypothetical protein
MLTLIQNPAGHMCFVTAHTHSDGATSDLYPAKLAVEFFLIANEKDREAFLSHDQIQSILAPTIQATCRLTPAQALFFPIPLSTRNGTELQMTTHPLRPVPIRPATHAPTAMMGPFTPPWGRFTEPISRVHPYLGHITSYTFPTRPLKIFKLCWGIATGLEAFLKAGYTVASYTLANTDPDTHTAVYNRLSRLSSQYPHLLSPENTLK